jgi:hypothetical protein
MMPKGRGAIPSGMHEVWTPALQEGRGKVAEGRLINNFGICGTGCHWLSERQVLQPLAGEAPIASGASVPPLSPRRNAEVVSESFLSLPDERTMRVFQE